MESWAIAFHRFTFSASLAKLNVAVVALRILAMQDAQAAVRILAVFIFVSLFKGLRCQSQVFKDVN